MPDWTEWLSIQQQQPDYDYQGYANKYGYVPQGGGHLTDEFKLPNHITFSDQSKYHSFATPGGQWRQNPQQRWAYTPSPYVIRQQGIPALQDYFKRNEPASQLILPKGTQK